MLLELEERLDARPAWARRLEARWRARLEHDERARRRALAGAIAIWQFGELILPRHQVTAVRAVLLAMIVFDSIATWVWVHLGIAIEGNPIIASLMQVFGDGIGLAIRTAWSVGLVFLLTWLAERRAVARPALAFLVVALGMVTLLHSTALGWMWATQILEG